MIPEVARWFTVSEAAEYVRLGKRAFYERVVHDPTMPRTRVGTRVVFGREELDAWMRRQQIAGDDPRAILKGRGRGHKKATGGGTQ